MTVKDLIDKNVFNVINTGEDTTKRYLHHIVAIY